MREGFESTLLWALGISAFALVGMFVAVFIIYFSGPSASSQHLQYFGQVGDFFGGMLNPILAFASFIALLYTIKLQSAEMKESRNELQQSRLAQQEAARAASTQLKQQISLTEYTGLIKIFSDELDVLQDLYKKSCGGIFGHLMNHFLNRRGISHQRIVSELPQRYSEILDSDEVSNFVIAIQNAKRTAGAIDVHANCLGLKIQDSVYGCLVGRLVAFCVVASLLARHSEIALETNNPVLHKYMVEFFLSADVEPPPFMTLDTPQS